MKKDVKVDTYEEKIGLLVTQDMIKERWYPDIVPVNEKGNVDFTELEKLWMKEVEKRSLEYQKNALSGDDVDMYNVYHYEKNETPNIDRILEERKKSFNSVYVTSSQHDERISVDKYGYTDSSNYRR